ncbi:HEAT repeat domain-containing protein [Lacisediminihabitans sp.]|uniref:HEAT repeat domain-containing protein n=1 Tax=Lacisediminihabitans sp. TaxID=2787631 RepID=UPI00374CEDA5
MPARREDELRAVPAAELAGYLTARSGLPGPRGNLELADAFAAVADRETILRFAHLDDEYLRFCGTEAAGRLVAAEPGDASLVSLLRERAADPLWRVREAAARALQLIGDARPDRLRAIVADWLTDADGYVRRAAVAGICEPRLLADPTTASAAIDACSSATDWIRSLPADRRREPAVRNLRQALGYCWSVAVAASPAAGLAAFDRLRAVDDPDIRWIVSTNLTKARLRRILETETP